MSRITTTLEDDELRQLKADVGFESRYAPMTSGYKPLVHRVMELEKIVEALQDHLGVTVVKEQYVAKPKPTER